MDYARVEYATPDIETFQHDDTAHIANINGCIERSDRMLQSLEFTVP
jgi:hypothetical protein